MELLKAWYSEEELQTRLGVAGSLSPTDTTYLRDALQRELVDDENPERPTSRYEVEDRRTAGWDMVRETAPEYIVSRDLDVDGPLLVSGPTHLEKTGATNRFAQEALPSNEPGSANLFLAGMAYRSRGDRIQAVERFARACESNPKSFYWLYAVECLVASGFDEIASSFVQAFLGLTELEALPDKAIARGPLTSLLLLGRPSITLALIEACSKDPETDNRETDSFLGTIRALVKRDPKAYLHYLESWQELSGAGTRSPHSAAPTETVSLRIAGLVTFGLTTTMEPRGPTSAENQSALLLGLIPAATTSSVPIRQMNEWLELWSRSGAPELEIPLELLEAALRFHETRDRRHLLELPKEEREILLRLIQTPGARPALEAKIAPTVSRLEQVVARLKELDAEG